MVQAQNRSSLTSDAATLVATAVNHIWDNYTGYAIGHLNRTELAHSIERNVKIAVAVVTRGSAPTADELFAGRDLGARRAMQSIPLESVIQAFRAVERTLLDDLLENSLPRSAKATRQSVDLLIDTFDMLTQETINSYHEASIAIDAQTERFEGDLVMSLTAGLEPNPEQFAQQTRLLAVDPEGTYIATVLLGPLSANPLEMLRLRRQLTSMMGSLLPGRILFGTVPGGAALLTPSDLPVRTIGAAIQDVLRRSPFRDEVVAGVSTTVTSLRSVESAYRQALACAEVGQRLGLESQILYHDDYLLDVMLVRQEAISGDLEERCVGPLKKHRHLIETLRALFQENLSQARAAERLVVHPNTIAYRLRRIKDLTGFNPLYLKDAVELSIALKAVDLAIKEKADAPFAPRVR